MSRFFNFRQRERAFESLNRQLLEFSGAFSTITDVAQLVPTLVGKISDLLRVRESALFLLNNQRDKFEMKHCRNIELSPALRLRGDYYFTPNDKIVRWLLNNRKPFLMSTMPDVFGFFSEEERDILRFINAEVCVGMEAHNRFIGMLCLGRRSDGSDFEETDLQLLVTITAQAALAFENNRLQQEALEQLRAKRELEIAGELQRRLLPEKPPTGYPGLDIDGICIPSTEVGGDYFEFFPISDEKLGLVIGDVAGHGMSAGLLMGMAKSCVITAVKIDPSVSKVMDTLNSLIFELPDPRAMMTCLYALLDLKTGSFTFSNGGHVHPYYYDGKKDKLITLDGSSYPLGVRIEYTFPVEKLKLKPGDFVITCSDGFIESRDRGDEMFGYDRFLDSVYEHRKKNASDLIQSIRDDLFRFLSGNPHQDDLTLVMLKMKE